ncbi:MAG: TetR/AcrR family transcriptional regulator [Streptosporangiales bacterium]
MTGPSIQRSPGRPARLSRDAVVSVAAALVEAEGIDALTMRRVADELNASPMALYRHVRDKDELLVLLLDRLVENMHRPDLPSDPRRRVVVLLDWIRDGLAGHPWVVGVLAAGDLMAPAVLWAVEGIHAALGELGLAPAAAASAYRVLWRYTVGDLTIETRTAANAALRDRPSMQATLFDSLDEHEFPALTAVARTRGSGRQRGSYADDIDAILGGLLPGF